MRDERRRAPRRRYHPERTAERLRSALERVIGLARAGRHSAYSARCADSPTSCACCSPAPRRAGSGFSPGPLTDLRKARHAARARGCGPGRCGCACSSTTRRRCTSPSPPRSGSTSAAGCAGRSATWPPERADLVWVFTQDPLTTEVRAWLDAQLRRVRPGVRVLNPPAVYDAYHEPDCFPRLAAGRGPGAAHRARAGGRRRDAGGLQGGGRAGGPQGAVSSTTGPGPASAPPSRTTAAAPTAGTAATGRSCWVTSCCPRT